LYDSIMISRRDEVLTLLTAFRHGYHTNVAKSVMNNRDACALILWKMGPQTKSQLTSILNAWRGKPRAQTYLFNSSHSGGYGCVAVDPMQRGWTMSNDGWSGIVRQPSPGFKTFFRRTYWYRISKGTYAPTAECTKRMAELGFI